MRHALNADYPEFDGCAVMETTADIFVMHEAFSNYLRAAELSKESRKLGENLLAELDEAVGQAKEYESTAQEETSYHLPSGYLELILDALRYSINEDNYSYDPFLAEFTWPMYEDLERDMSINLAHSEPIDDN